MKKENKITRYALFRKINFCVKYLLFVTLIINQFRCKKYVVINSLTDQLLATQVFSNDATANSNASRGSLGYRQMWRVSPWDA